MRFVTLKLMGGLGNQLFQYAMARAQMKNNDRLLFDLSNYSNDYYGRNFTLHKFNITGQILERKKLLSKLFFGPSVFQRAAHALALFSSIEEKGFYFHNEIKNCFKTFTYIEGYWQSENYFRSIRVQLKKEIVPKALPQLPDFLQQKNTVVIHVRRKDFLDDARFGVIGKEYYDNAIYQIRLKISNPSFVFFSDDIEWCRDNFCELNSTFCEHLPDYIRLYLMTQCKHHIISNSSFAWWGAWLCNNPQQVVIRPAQPFRDASLEYENYYPDNWIPVANQHVEINQLN